MQTNEYKPIKTLEDTIKILNAVVNGNHNGLTQESVIDVVYYLKKYKNLLEWIKKL